MMDYLRLVRYPNLLVVILTMGAIRYGIVAPMLETRGYAVQMPFSLFALLVFATVCLTAAGYVINDYFDRKTDLINHPETVIVGKIIPRREAMAIHTVLNVLGVTAGVVLSFSVHVPLLGLCFIGASGVLWLYSASFKRRFLIGNLIVAAFAACVPLVVVFYEIPLLRKAYSLLEALTQSNLWEVFLWVAVFGGFAFFTTLCRELIKDAEDFKGDSAAGRQTMPVVWGLKGTQKAVNFLVVVTAILVLGVYTSVLMFNDVGKIDVFNTLYLFILIIGPLAYIARTVKYAIDKKAFTRASLAMKVVMISGVLFSVRIWFMLQTL